MKGLATSLLAVAVTLAAIGLTGCAKLTDAEFSWCADHREQVRQAAAELATEDVIDWPMQGPPDQFDATYADACRRALAAGDSPR